MNNISNKGFKMALPFLAGALVGGLAIYAFNNRKAIQNSLLTGLDKGKEIAKKAKDSSLKVVKLENLSSEKPVKTRKPRKPQAKKAPHTDQNKQDFEI